MGTVFFPLDEELSLLTGRYTPRLQGSMTRLGSKLPFQEAAEELYRSHHTAISEPTCRRVTYRSGEAAEAIACQAVDKLRAKTGEVAVSPEQLMVSADGSFVQLTTGEWCEVKSVAVGEFAVEGVQGVGKQVVKTRNISYFSRSYKIRRFEHYAWSELHRRGVDKADRVVTVNDGAAWIQSFIDYHCPQAVRILDFAHVLEYISQAGKAIWGQESDAFKSWFERMAHQLKHKPPHYTLADLRLLQPKAKTDAQAAVLDQAIFYIQTRLPMVDYPFFRSRGLPIGSGCVESGHKVVVQRRLKGAGMRWAPHHIDPILALRDLACSRRWSQGWLQIVSYRQSLSRQNRLPSLHTQEPTATQPLTFSKLKAAGLLPTAEKSSVVVSSDKPSPRPSDDHPWRNNLWPTRESWRWN